MSTDDKKPNDQEASPNTSTWPEHLPKTTRLHEEFDTAKVVLEEPREEAPPFWGGVDESSKAVN
jgi:hypothetical protein